MLSQAYRKHHTVQALLTESVKGELCLPLLVMVLQRAKLGSMLRPAWPDNFAAPSWKSLTMLKNAHARPEPLVMSGAYG